MVTVHEGTRGSSFSIETLSFRLVEPGQTLAHRRNKLQFLRNILKRSIVGHPAQHVLHDLLVA